MSEIMETMKNGIKAIEDFTAAINRLAAALQTDKPLHIFKALVPEEKDFVPPPCKVLERTIATKRGGSKVQKDNALKKAEKGAKKDIPKAVMVGDSLFTGQHFRSGILAVGVNESGLKKQKKSYVYEATKQVIENLHNDVEILQPIKRRYTDEDDSYIRNNYLKKSDKQLAEDLKRTAGSIEQRRYKLGCNSRTQVIVGKAVVVKPSPQLTEKRQIVAKPVAVNSEEVTELISLNKRPAAAERSKEFTDRDNEIIARMYKERKSDATIAEVLGFSRDEHYLVRDQRVVVLGLKTVTGYVNTNINLAIKRRAKK